jgi:glycosyltransferase involved in cell wall biosynthesis
MSHSCKRIALISGHDPAVDRDAVGQYTEKLYQHCLGMAQDQLRIDLLQFRPKSNREWLFDYAKAIRNYDLAHLQYPAEGWGTSPLPGLVPGFVRKTLQRRTKLVCTFHEWRSMHPLRKASVIPLATASDGIIFVSRQEKEAFAFELPYRIRFQKPEIRVIPIGVNLKIPVCDRAEIRSRRDGLVDWNGVPADFLIGYFGFIYAGKQPYKLLQTTKALHNMGLKARLVLAGDFQNDHQQDREAFLAMVKTLKLEDYVLLLGYVEDERILAALLSACNVILLLFDEGVSARRGSFWYALELGAPVVTTTPQSGREFEGLLSFANFKIGFVNPSAAPEAIAAQLLRFRFFEPPVPLPKLAPDWKRIAEQHLELYQNLGLMIKRR